MKNIEILNEHIKKYGANSVLIHTIPNSETWLISEKIEDNKWLLTLMNPLGTIQYRLGQCTDKQICYVWEKLIRMEVENYLSQNQLAKQIRSKIKQFLSQYNKFIKRSKTK